MPVLTLMVIHVSFLDQGKMHFCAAAALPHTTLRRDPSSKCALALHHSVVQHSIGVQTSYVKPRVIVFTGCATVTNCF